MTRTQRNETSASILVSRKIYKRILQISLYGFFSPIKYNRKRSNNLEKTLDTRINVRAPSCDR